MTGVNSYSTTAANNVQANTGINWDEGMPPGSVNNSARANMADLRAAFNDLNWFQYGKGDLAYTPVYVSSTQYKIAGTDVSSVYHVGRRTKVVGSSTGTIYGTISAVSFSTDTTVTVTWDSGSLSNETFTSVSISQLPVTGMATGTGKVVLSASPTLSGTIAGNLAFSGTITPSSTNGIVGTTTNDSANAGSVGEYISSSVASGSAISLTDITATNVTSISLTAGDWDVCGMVASVAAGSTTINFFKAWISSTSATDPGAPDGGAYVQDNNFPAAGSNCFMPVGTIRISVASTTTVYLSVMANFSVSTLKAYGFIGARRRR